MPYQWAMESWMQVPRFFNYIYIVVVISLNYSNESWKQIDLGLIKLTYIKKQIDLGRKQIDLGWNKIHLHVGWNKLT